MAPRDSRQLARALILLGLTQQSDAGIHSLQLFIYVIVFVYYIQHYIYIYVCEHQYVTY